MPGLTRGATGPVPPPPISCADEPIHIPGHIQPHGVLLATAAGGMRISHVSANCQQRLGLAPTALLGTDIAVLLGEAAAAALDALRGSATSAPGQLVALALPIPIRPHRTALIHRHQDRFLVEMEDLPIQDGGVVPVSKAQFIASDLRQATTLEELCARAVREVRLLTGYDRVMVYRFEPEGSGTVVAEERRNGMVPYLGLRYPESDIPAQARRLYMRQRVRSIPDATYRPVPLIAAAAETMPLDMTFCALRGVSPVHLQYMQNMGVRASLSLALPDDTTVREGGLWGMILCHHDTPRAPSASLRAACDIIGQIMSFQLIKVIRAEATAARLVTHRAIANLCDDVEASGDVAETLLRRSGDVRAVMQAGGALLRCGGQLRLVGNTPPEAAALAVMADIRRQFGETVTALSDAGESTGPASAFAAVASGILLLPFGPGNDDAIAWFRPEMLQTIRWGGDPRKPSAAAEPGGRLQPRRSFDAWIEQQRGRALPWSDAEVQAAHTLRRAILASLRREAEARLAHLSAFDALTGLANRRTLDAEMERWRSARLPAPAALLFFDLDRFKTINDSLGHAAGDAVLVQVAERLRAIAPAGSTPSRLGGDEFILFWPAATRAMGEALADALVRELARPYALLDRSYHTNASVGLAWAAPGATADLLREADAAMYAAKRQGGGRAVAFEPTLHAAVLNDLETEQDLFRALERDELEIHYQPVLTVPRRLVYCMEALMRWRHPQRGWITPSEFIPRAEEAGLMNRLGAWVMTQAVRQIGIWRRQHPGLIVSINISARQLQEGTLNRLMAEILAREHVAAAAICIEVTETALMLESAVRALRELRALGVSIAMGGFGTGHASLSNLQGLPLDTVKIDRRFVAPLGTAAQGDRFFRAIVDLVHTLDLRAVAEGCETETQWRAIAASGCEAAQGWLVAEAMDATTAGHFLAQANA